MRTLLFVLASARPDGNTEALARHAAAGLPDGTPQRWLNLTEFPLPAFEDIRHVSGIQYAEPSGNERVLLDATMAASDLVVASPLYWYSVSASAKLYLDYWTYWLHNPQLDFKARMRRKTLWGISAISEEDPAKADPLIGTLRLTAEYLGMRWGGALLGYGNRPGQVCADVNALAKAPVFFAADVAEVAPQTA